MPKLLAWLKPRQKALAAFLVAVVAGAVAQGLIVGQAAAVVTVIVGAVATLGVHQAPYEPPQ